MPLVFSTLRVLTFALGLVFVYLAAFTYETTDARVRNTLEDLWLKLEFGPRTPVVSATPPAADLVMRVIEALR